MLVHERNDDTLVLAQATPRKWLKDGARISVVDAPTYYGNLSMLLESRADSDEIAGEFELSGEDMPTAVFARFRHPSKKKIQSVLVNGRDWADFEVEKEWVRIEKPDQKRYRISVSY
jgi:hypothetical protein